MATTWVDFKQIKTDNASSARALPTIQDTTGLGPNRMMVAPIRQTAAPTMSHRSGRVSSTIQSHKSGVVM
jgi:hypothetical protein